MLPRLLLILLLAAASTAAPLASPSDAAAMRAISASISASSALNWSPSDDPCSWPLVTCSAGRVTAIQIGRRNLSGTLPPSAFSALTSILRLELPFNSLSGPLPSLRGLSALQVVLLHHNRFSSVPPDFFSGLSSLQSISLDSNPFNPPWSIPSSLSNASTLVSFSANSCNLRGPFPSLFSPDNFPSLNHLALAYNSLSGPLPRSLAGSPLHSLWVNNQQGQDGVLSGPLDVIAEMLDLSELWLHSNNFSGPIPDLHKLGSLQVLNLRDNKLTGPVPASLIALNSLKNVTLTNNLLQGPVPVFPPGVNLELNVASESFCLSTPGDCDARVSILLGIAGGFGYPAIFAENWKGNNPCNSWIGISCDRGGNVTVVNFKSMGLEGTISKEFAKLGSVQRVLLSGNKISGSIPEELTGLAELKEFDASYNLLTGTVPAFGKGVLISLSGNPGLNNRSSSTGSPGSPLLGGGSSGSPAPGIGGDDGRKSSSVAPVVIVASVFGGIALLLCIGLLGFYVYKKKKNPFGRVRTPTTVIHPRHSNSDPDLVKITVASSGVNGATTGTTSESLSPTNSALGDVHMVESGNMVISIQVLRNVTNNFSHENIIGQGGFGTVYKGELHDGTKIAVKRMESGVMGSKGLTEFQSEIAVLTKVRHRHLVSLLGYCLDGNERLLVYEYMPQGTLSQHLFNWREECSKPLEWKKRLSIALDVARGVEYLHTLAHQSFIHRDLKPLNILLGDDMRAKVADFGLVRLAPDGKCSVETRLAGTFGYLAPEYAVTGRVTTKADVFSFGVILMELITGRKALDESQPEESVHLVTWFRRMQLSKESFKKAIDPTIDLDEETMASVSTVAELAGHCCAREPYQRPEMGHAVNVLSSLSEMWKPSDPDSEDSCGIDFDMTLPQALKKWQEFEDTTSSDAASSSFLASMDNTQTSIPTRPSGFADSFTSADGR